MIFKQKPFIMNKILILLCFIFLFQSCKKDNENQWKIEEELPVSKVEINDISKDYYDVKLELADFQKKYPWFQGSVSDEAFSKRRASVEERKVYLDGLKKVNVEKLSTDLGVLFSRVKFYFPDFKNPTVFIFSSATQMASEPIIYDKKSNFMFIDVSGFLGSKDPFYKGIEKYLTESMNSENLMPKISESIAYDIVPFNKDHQKFLDQMVYSGKIMTLQDAFLPDVSDNNKMHYTKKQYDWSVANEANIWSFFIENDLLFSADPRLEERFIIPAPFSKFYTEIDNESSPQVGVFIGWEICKKFMNEKPDTTLDQLLKMNATDIFNESAYKPK